MEENREPLSAIAIEKKLQLLRNKQFSEDTIALVKSDYEYGLKEEEISLYLNKSYDIEQMKILSECLHKDVPKDMIDIIKNTKYSVHQMQVSLEFYEKGVPVQTIKEVMDKGEKPITMRRLYEEVLEQLNKVKKQIPEESEYVKALISQMDEVDCQHFFRQIFLGYFSDIVQAFDTLRKNVCGDDYTSLHNPIVLSSVLPAYGMFHSIQILFL